MKTRDWLIIILIIFISVFTLKDLFMPFFYTSHDGVNQIVRLYYYDQSLKDGQIPPRWAGGLLQGFGYPLFIFSYHMPWLIAEPFHLFGLSIIDSVKMTFLAGFIISGITMYFCVKQLYGKAAAITATIIYLFAPVRFSDIFVRAAIGDATAFIFFPIIFLSLNKLKTKSHQTIVWLVVGSISFAGLILSHAMVLLLFALSILLYVALTVFRLNNKTNYLKNVFLMLSLGILLSSYYLFPSFVERNFTVFNGIMKPLFAGKTYLKIQDLLYSSWGYGVVTAKEGAMSLQFGIAQWVAFTISILVLIKLMRVPKKTSDFDFYEGFNLILIFIFSILLMLPVSEFIWVYIRKIALIDFTWRVLPISLFYISIITGFIIRHLGKRYKYATAFILIMLAFYANRNHTRINQIQDWPVEFYLKLVNTTNSFDEYSPKWIESSMVKKPKDKIQIMDGIADIKIEQNKSNRLFFTLDATKSGRIRVNTVYYPGWNMYVDKVPQDMETHNGLMETVFQKGRHEYNFIFSDTPFRKVSNTISIISGVFIIFILIKYRKYES
jgi:hypothetical protein